MSYTVAVHGKEPLESKICLNTLAKTSESFLIPGNGKNSHGFIEIDGKSCVVISCIDPNISQEELVRRTEAYRGECLSGGIRIDRVFMSGVEVLYATFLTKEPQIRFVQEIFSGVRSRSWIMENTAVYTSFHRYIGPESPLGIKQRDLHPCDRLPTTPGSDSWYTAEFAPPRLLKLDTARRLLLFSVGNVTGYWEGNYDPRGVVFREEEVRRIPYGRMNDYSTHMFGAEISRRSQDSIEQGLFRLTSNEVTGMQHAFTAIHPDKLYRQVRVSHLLHEKAQFVHLKTQDTQGTELVITGQIPAERFAENWPVPIKEPLENINRIYTKTVYEKY